MPMEWIIHTLGRLESKFDAEVRVAREWRQHFNSRLRDIDRRVDRGKHGSNGWKKIYMQVIMLLLIMVVGVLARVYPGAFKGALGAMFDKLLGAFLAG